ncbi:hypothetical protein MINS_24740 [Mycolicibacterium insubricum]|uniref:Uncharacterized protein n=1 Tax=Mycolicibacterium insubricum TaxID=444597 RepID=A0A1X0DF53_9MYCO|nr:hypothetical protein [Mycolicibacterium insubricum]MCV7081457.1 hypothetical protein [Mycolicibacterium insubricum]ORA71034.1 hypothetical protein BST26_09135 [Mycolicibacterium insubricum]BBZ67045.1 hypothetical protein MINS_24740 [Mycolicibacterium insubricum]
MAAPAHPDLLDYLDQAMFLGLRATGQAAVMQCIWIYQRAVDLDGVHRFHRNFGRGLAGRRIEPSPLPFGRHRWASGAPGALDVGTDPIPRSDVADWLDHRARLPIDPQWGPGWHLAVQPLTDGGTVISLVGSHCLADGGGGVLEILNAVNGTPRTLGHQPVGARTRRRALAADARQLVRDLPTAGRALRQALRTVARDNERRRRPIRSAEPRRRDAVPTDHGNVVVASVTCIVAADRWRSRAESLGGNSHSLLAGFTARLGHRMGRGTGPDGTVALIVPINDRRSLDDTRANAVRLGDVRIDPRRVTTDLSVARADIREALDRLDRAPDPTLHLLPLIPYVPKRAVGRLAETAFGFADQPASCSNMGVLPAEVARLDGADADYVAMRGIDRHITRSVLEQRSGLLTVVGAQVGAHLSIAVVGYQPGAVNTRAWLADLVAATLSDFALDGVGI